MALLRITQSDERLGSFVSDAVAPVALYSLPQCKHHHRVTALEHPQVAGGVDALFEVRRNQTVVDDILQNVTHKTDSDLICLIRIDVKH